MDPFNLVNFFPQVSHHQLNHMSSMSSSNQNPNLKQFLNPIFGSMRISPTTALVDGSQLGLNACNADVFHNIDPATVHELVNCLSKHDMLPEPSSTDTRANQFASMTSMTSATPQCNQLSPLSDTPSSSNTVSSTTSLGTSVNSSASLNAANNVVVNNVISEDFSQTNAFAFLNSALNTLISTEVDQNCSSPSDDVAGSSNGNGGVLLCQVCSDRASGFHYGVTSCEGCKGFFRRSIQQKIQYRACTKGQRCAIVRNNRNRCQDCRLKKCMSVGMSRDAVRFGRVPKREKVKMVEEMQRASVRSQLDQLSVELEDVQAIMNSIFSAFNELGDSIQLEYKRGISYDHDKGFSVNSKQFLSLIRSVVTFSKAVKGFSHLYQQDRIQCLKSSFFPILLIRFSCIRSFDGSLIEPQLVPSYLLLDPEDNSDQGTVLRNGIVEFVQRFRMINMTEQALPLLAAMVMTQSESDIGTSTHLPQASLIKMIQEKLWFCMQTMLFNKPMDQYQGSLLFQSIIAVFSDLRLLNGMYEDVAKTAKCLITLEEPSTLSLNNLLKPNPLNFVDEIRPKQPSAIAQLLEKPSLVLAPSMNNNGVKAEEEVDEDQPLNLCLRDRMETRSYA